MSADPEFSNLITPIQHSEFKFNDSGEFTYIKWNTYKRTLVIFCSSQDKVTLEASHLALYDLCDKVHGEHDAFLLMSLDIIAKASLSSDTQRDKLIKLENTYSFDTTENFINNGGFGKVYKYYDSKIDELYAFKFYDPSAFQTSTEEIMKTRFIREGKKLLHYSHENIVKCYDYGEFNNRAYLKLEYVDGTDLLTYIQNNNLTPNTKERLCKQYISGMSYIHSKTDNHRDISYSNVMVTKNDIIKIIDFGFARNPDDVDLDTKYYDIDHKFIPNELPYTQRTEIYCIGAILYSIMCNTYFSNEWSNIIESRETPLIWKQIIKKCLKDNPNERFSSAVEIEASLQSKGITEQLPLSNSSLSLEPFREMLNSCHVGLLFNNNVFPDEIDIAAWLNVGIQDELDNVTFLEKMNITKLFSKLSGFRDVFCYQNSCIFVEKNTIIKTLSNFKTLPDTSRLLYVKTMHTVLEDYFISSDDLPFE